MPMRTLRLVGAVWIVLGFCTHEAIAQRSPERTVQIAVGGVLLVVPIPQGFASAAHDKQLMAEGEAATPHNRRLLAFFLPSSDIEARPRGKEPEFRFSYSMQTNPKDEVKTFSAETFLKVKAQVRNAFEAMPTEIRAGRRPEKLDETLREHARETGELIRVDIQSVVPLGEVEESETSITAAFLTNTKVRTSFGSNDVAYISAITVAAVKGKPIWLVTRAKLENDADIELTRVSAKDWIRSIQASN
jgi:hypothetical protein